VVAQAQGGNAVFAVGINLLSLLCYFAHMVALTIALFTIGVIWLFDFDRTRWRRWLLLPVLLLPQVSLPLWYMLSHQGNIRPNPWPPAFRWIYLKELLILFLCPGAIALASRSRRSSRCSSSPHLSVSGGEARQRGMPSSSPRWWL
jgi:hypothetical protein